MGISNTCSGTMENDFRLVVQERISIRINERITDNAWTIPKVETSIANLSHQKFYSIIDLKERLYGVELTEDNTQKSAVITTWGL